MENNFLLFKCITSSISCVDCCHISPHSMRLSFVSVYFSPSLSLSLSLYLATSLFLAHPNCETKDPQTVCPSIASPDRPALFPQICTPNRLSTRLMIDSGMFSSHQLHNKAHFSATDRFVSVLCIEYYISTRNVDSDAVQFPQCAR